MYELKAVEGVNITKYALLAIIRYLKDTLKAVGGVDFTKYRVHYQPLSNM